MKRYILPAIGALAVIAALVAIYAASVTGTPPGAPPAAHAQGLAAPGNQQARNNGNPGEAVVTWNAVPGAAGYRVGWMNNNDYEAARNLPGNQWLEQFTYADISRPSATQRTVTRLTPGDEYWFIVGTRNPNGTVAWPSAWVQKFAVTPDARVCPTDQPGPPDATPAPTAVPTATPAPTPTPAAGGGVCAAATGALLQNLINTGVCPAPTPTPTPQSDQSSLLDFQNGRWLQQYHPEVYRTIAALPWIADGLTTLYERNAAEDLLYVAADDTPATAQKLARMPFLSQYTPGDASALRSLSSIAYFDGQNGTSHLRTIMAHPTVASGITDAWTPVIATLIIAATERPSLIGNMLDPSAGSLNERYINLPQAGRVRLVIVRVDNLDNPPAYMNMLERAARQTEQFMGSALPTDMVATVFHPRLILSAGVRGANYAGGASLLLHERYDDGATPISIGAIEDTTNHELAHYYWTGDQRWINEGMADMMSAVFKTRREGTPLAAGQYPCPQHNTLASLNSNPPAQEAPAFICNYTLGERLFLGLYMRAGDTAFRNAAARLYQAYKGTQDLPLSRVAAAFVALESVFRSAYQNGATVETPTPRPNWQLPELNSRITDIWVMLDTSGNTDCYDGRVRSDTAVSTTMSLRQANSGDVYLCMEFARQRVGDAPSTVLSLLERHQDGFIYSNRGVPYGYPNPLWDGVVAPSPVGPGDGVWKPGRHTFYLQKDGQDRAAYTLIVTP